MKREGRGSEREGKRVGKVHARRSPIVANGGSCSGNANWGVISRDLITDFFCGDADCTLGSAAQATVQLLLDKMRLEANGTGGVALAPGGQASIRRSIIRDGGYAGVVVDSILDYDVVDGVVRHADILGSATVRDSTIQSSTGWCALAHGTSRLDLGGAEGGRNSCLSSGFGAVANITNPAVVVPAEGNWWDTADPAAISAMMFGPVDFVPFLTAAP